MDYVLLTAGIAALLGALAAVIGWMLNHVDSRQRGDAYGHVMNEIRHGMVEPSDFGRALERSEGDKNKARSLYVESRARAYRSRPTAWDILGIAAFLAVVIAAVTIPLEMGVHARTAQGIFAVTAAVVFAALVYRADRAPLPRALALGGVAGVIAHIGCQVVLTPFIG